MPVFTIDTLRTTIGEKAFMRLADRDGDRILGQEDADAVEDAIAAGQGDIDSRIKGKFDTSSPITASEYRRHVLNAIIFHMHAPGSPITDDVCKRYDYALKWAKEVQTDQAQITGEEPELRRKPAATQTGPGRKFTAAKLSDVL